MENTTKDPLGAEPLWTVQDLATYTKKSVESIYKLCQSNAIPYYRFGGAIRFIPKEILTYLKSRKNESRTRYGT